MALGVLGNIMGLEVCGLFYVDLICGNRCKTGQSVLLLTRPEKTIH